MVCDGGCFKDKRKKCCFHFVVSTWFRICLYCVEVAQPTKTCWYAEAAAWELCPCNYSIKHHAFGCCGLPAFVDCQIANSTTRGVELRLRVPSCSPMANGRRCGVPPSVAICVDPQGKVDPQDTSSGDVATGRLSRLIQQPRCAVAEAKSRRRPVTKLLVSDC